MNGGIVAMKIPAIGMNDDKSVNKEKNSMPLIYRDDDDDDDNNNDHVDNEYDN